MTNPFIQRAVNSFLLINVTIRKADPMKKSAIAAAAAIEGTKLANGVPLVARVGSLGTLTNDLKQVVSHFNAVRTYMYTFTAFTTAEEGEHNRGARLIPTARVPEVLVKLTDLKAQAFAALNEFMPRYQSYYQARNSMDFGQVRDVELPHPDDLRAKFDVIVRDPQPIPVFDADKLNLPAGLAADIAARHEATLSKQLENAKQIALGDAEEHMLKVERQLTEGSRLHQSLIDLSAHHSKNLRGITEGYDNDPRVIALADLIDDQIASLGNIANAKTNWGSRSITSHRGQSAARAASAAAKSIKAIRSNPAQPTQPTTVVVGDSLLADLID